MSNPLFSKVATTSTMTISAFKSALSKQGPDFLNKMVAVAKQRGISQADIDAGLKMLKAI